jgi:16S rRNA (guanine527-N7)-methyltransferase
LELILKYFPQLSKEQVQQFAALDALYKEWNAKINVISRKDMDGLYQKHVLHSLSIAKIFQFPPGLRVIDIGTGGGFPGIPLAIYFPEVHFHLTDSIGKKIKVTQAIADALQLKNVTTEHIRSEEIKNRKFEVAVSRAVAPLSDLIQWSKPILNKNNHPNFIHGLICLKGGDLTEEIANSKTHPHIFSIYQYFPEKYFEEKYVLQVAF